MQFGVLLTIVSSSFPEAFKAISFLQSSPLSLFPLKFSLFIITLNAAPQASPSHVSFQTVSPWPGTLLSKPGLLDSKLKESVSL